MSQQEPIEELNSRLELQIRAFQATNDRERQERIWEEIFKICAPLVRGILRRHLRDQRDRDEVLNDTFAAVNLRLSDFHWKSSPTTWLVAIAIHKALDRVRSNGAAKNRLSVVPEISMLTIQTTAGAMDDELKLAVVSQTLGELSDEDRGILVERFWNDESWQRVGERRGKTKNAMRMQSLSILKRARRIFDTLLDKVQH